MNPSKLSDIQLYALVTNKNLTEEVAELVKEEFDRRNFDLDTLDKLDLELRAKSNSSSEPLSLRTKLLIMAFPFPIVLIGLIANRHIGRGNWVKWRQYWRYIVIGHLIWFFLFIMAVRYLF